MEHVRNDHPIQMPQYIHARIADVYRTNLSSMRKPVLHGIPADWTMLLSSVDCAAQPVSCWIWFIFWDILLVVKHFRSVQYCNELVFCSLGVILMGHILRQIQNLEENIKMLKPYRTAQRGSILIFWAVCSHNKTGAYLRIISIYNWPTKFMDFIRGFLCSGEVLQKLKIGRLPVKPFSRGKTFRCLLVCLRSVDVDILKW